MQKGQKKQKNVGNHPINKNCHNFYFGLQCQDHPKNRKSTPIQPYILYGPGDPDLDGKTNLIPTIKCSESEKIWHQKYLKFIQKLKPFGYDIFKYQNSIKQNRKLHGRNKTILQKEALKWQSELSWNYVERNGDEPQKAILIMKKYYCCNEAEFLPRPLASLTNKKPKFIFRSDGVATLKQKQFPSKLLLKEGTVNNFRSVIETDFGSGAFSNEYFFSEDLPSGINVGGMYKLSKTKQQHVRHLQKIHERLPLRIDKSTIPQAGRGVFTDVDIPPYTMVMLYVGQQRNVLENWPPSDSVYDLGFIELNDEGEKASGNNLNRLIPLVVEPITKLNAARYINTTKNHYLVNLEIQKIAIGGVIGLLLSTGQNGAKAGSQLFYDYGQNYGFGPDYMEHLDAKGGLYSRCVEDKMSQDKKTRMTLSRWKKRLRNRQLIEQSDVLNSSIQEEEVQPIDSDSDMGAVQGDDEHSSEQNVDHINPMKPDRIQSNNYSVECDKPSVSKVNQMQFEELKLKQVFQTQNIQNQVASEVPIIDEIEEEKMVSVEASEVPIIDEIEEEKMVSVEASEVPIIDEIEEEKMVSIEVSHQIMDEKALEKQQKLKQRSQKKRYGSIDPELARQMDNVKTISGKKLSPVVRIARFYKRYTRIQLRGRLGRYPRMREWEVVNSIIRDWTRMPIGEKVNTYKQYIHRGLLKQQSDSQIYSDQSRCESPPSSNSEIPTPKIIKEKIKQKPTTSVRPFIQSSSQSQQSDFAREKPPVEFDISSSGESQEMQQLKEKMKRKQLCTIKKPEINVAKFSDFAAFIKNRIQKLVPRKILDECQDTQSFKPDQRHLLFGQEEKMVETRKHTFCDKSKCIICDKSVTIERRGNHLKQHHPNLRVMASAYLLIRRQQKFWLSIETDIFSSDICPKWNLVDIGVKHAWKNAKIKQIGGVDRLIFPNQMVKAIIEVDARQKRRRLKVKHSVRGQKTEQEDMKAPKIAIHKQKGQQLASEIKQSPYQWAQVSRFFKKLTTDPTMEIFDTDGNPANFEQITSNFYMNKGKRFYVKKNGHTIVIPSRSGFKKMIEKKSKKKTKIRQQIKKTKKISKKTQGLNKIKQNNVFELKDCTKKNYHVPRYAPWEKQVSDVFICPMCGQVFEKQRQWHIMLCMQFNVICKHCNTHYNKYEGHQCRLTNHIIQLGTTRLTVANHVDMIVGRVNQISTLIEQQGLMMLQQKTQEKEEISIDQEENPSDNYVNENKVLRLAHQQRSHRISIQKQRQQAELQQDNQLVKLGPNRGMEPSQLLKACLEKTKRKPKQVSKSKLKPSRAEYFRQCRRKYIEKFQQALYNMKFAKFTSKLMPYQIQFYSQSLRARISHCKWIQNNNECAVCLSEISPHVAQITSRIWSKYLLYDKNHFEVIELYRDSGVDHQNDSHYVRMGVIRLFANQKVLRQCQQCKKILHMICWLSVEQTMGDICPYCRSEGTVKPPTEIILTGTQDHFYLDQKNHLVNTMLSKLGVYL